MKTHPELNLSFKTHRWLAENVRYKGNDCLPWPYAINSEKGYGQVQFRGKVWKAHRLMCFLAHGEPPTPKHQTAHECGRGHLACTNPRHLSWKTNSENQKDRARHGTKSNGPGSSLTRRQIRRVRALRYIKPQRVLAEELGVKPGCIEYWQRVKHMPARLRAFP